MSTELLSHSDDLAAVFSSAGLLNARGKPPTAEAARKTWQRIRAPVRDRPAKTETTRASVEPTPRPARVPAPSPTALPIVPPPDDDPDDTPTFDSFVKERR